MLELNRRWFMQFIWTLVIGFLAGVIAKLLMPGRDPGGLIITTALGMAGALLAKYLGVMLGLYNHGDSAGLLASIVGAVIILAVYRLIVRRAAPH
jgi:uncharacterized membrane protein YeaQ/YmgE (transglycosylase-associated protein family)